MRTMLWLMSVAAVMGLATTATAQPGGGGRGPGGRPGDNDDRVRAALEKFDARLKELEQKVARPQTGGPASVGGVSRFGGTSGFSGFGTAAPFAKGPAPRVVPERGVSPKDGGRGPTAGGPRPFDRKGPGFERGRGPAPKDAGRRPSAAGSPSVERRIDRLIEELEQLKKDVRGSRR